MRSFEPFLSFWRALDALFAVEERTWWGAVVSDARYPAVQEANYARVETTRAVALEQIETALLPSVARTGSRREHVVVFSPEAQTELLVEASTRGERIAGGLVMVHEGSTGPPPDEPAEPVERPGGGVW